jgi:stearoyl-CoA desaturase (delta-9 desaturase)
MSVDLLERPDSTPASPPPAQPARATPVYRKVLTGIVAGAPVVLLTLVLTGVVNHPFSWGNLALIVGGCALIGHGVTIGFHRLFAHRAFVAKRPLKIVLALMGSLSFQGSVIGWVADHRRHHRYSDKPGDPHSPLWKGLAPLQGLRGFWHAHLGWCFSGTPTSRAEYAPDLLADRDLVFIDRLFLPCCVATLMIPFGIGFAVSGTLAGALSAFIWGGVIRVGISHNFTWSIDSICHTFGKRPFQTRDRSTNVAALALFTMGESFHNAHHAFPTSARHGVDRGQIDTSAWLIRLFERLGWASEVRWPTPALLATRRAVV